MMVNTDTIMLLMKSKFILQEYGNQVDIVDLWKYQNHSGITINNFFQLTKEKKVTFEDDMPNIKTEMNYNLFTHTIENSKRMEYSDQTVKLFSRDI